LALHCRACRDSSEAESRRLRGEVEDRPLSGGSTRQGGRIVFLLSVLNQSMKTLDLEVKPPTWGWRSSEEERRVKPC
jgi:hypothetical protein